jgi:hypothetical protein
MNENNVSAVMQEIGCKGGKRRLETMTQEERSANRGSCFRILSAIFRGQLCGGEAALNVVQGANRDLEFTGWIKTPPAFRCPRIRVSNAREGECIDQEMPERIRMGFVDGENLTIRRKSHTPPPE